jgi:hypothetical protein
VTIDGSSNWEVSRCVGGARQWDPDIAPLENCGSRTLRNAGGSLDFSQPGKVAFTGGEQGVGLPDPFKACSYGVHLFGVAAKGAFSAADLFNTKLGKFEVILRGHDHTDVGGTARSGIGRHESTTTSTVYVTLVRVR